MRKILGCIIVFILSYWMIRPLFVPGYFPMHDNTQVARVIEMGRSLRLGQFPVRWVPDLGYGYGYPIFNFYGPLPYYIGGLLYLFGFNALVATKLMFAIGIILAPMATFLFLESFIGFLPALGAAILYGYAPYHAVQIYVRGAVGEYWAIAFIPLFLYGIFVSFSKSRPLLGIITGSFFLAAIIISHTILGFVVTGMFLLGIGLFWIQLLVQKKLSAKHIWIPVSILLGGLGCSAFFWMPAFFEMSATGVVGMVANASTTFYDHFVCPTQFWFSPWGFGGSAPGCIDGMSFKFGKLHLIIAIFGFLLLLILGKKKNTSLKRIMVFAGIIFLISLFGMLEQSSPIWRIVPFSSFIQYPWRLLSISMLGLAILGGTTIAVWKIPVIRITITIAIVAAIISVNGKLFTPQYIYSADPKKFESMDELRFYASKISDEYLPANIQKPKRPEEIIQNPIDKNFIHVIQLVDKNTYLSAIVFTGEEQVITIKKAYFPGWRYWMNGQEIKPEIVDGLPHMVVSEGTSSIIMRLKDTPMRMAANYITVLSVIIFIGAYIYAKKTNA